MWDTFVGLSGLLQSTTEQRAVGQGSNQQQGMAGGAGGGYMGPAVQQMNVQAYTADHYKITELQMKVAGLEARIKKFEDIINKLANIYEEPGT